MKQTTKRFVSMILGLVLIVAALMMYFNFIKPAYDESQKIKSQQIGSSLFLTEEQATIQKVEDLISAYEEQSQVQDLVSLALPMREDTEGALAQIYGIAKNSGLTLHSASISSVGLQNVSSDLGGYDNIFSLQKPLGLLSFTLRLSGTYENFKDFLGFLETNIRIFDILNFSLNPSGAADGAGGGRYGYDLSVVTYYQIQK